MSNVLRRIVLVFIHFVLATLVGVLGIANTLVMARCFSKMTSCLFLRKLASFALILFAPFYGIGRRKTLVTLTASAHAVLIILIPATGWAKEYEEFSLASLLQRFILGLLALQLLILLLRALIYCWRLRLGQRLAGYHLYQTAQPIMELTMPIASHVKQIVYGNPRNLKRNASYIETEKVLKNINFSVETGSQFANPNRTQNQVQESSTAEPRVSKGQIARAQFFVSTRFERVITVIILGCFGTYIAWTIFYASRESSEPV